MNLHEKYFILLELFINQFSLFFINYSTSSCFSIPPVPREGDMTSLLELKTGVKNSNGALTSVYISGSSFKVRKYCEMQIRNSFLPIGKRFKIQPLDRPRSEYISLLNEHIESRCELDPSPLVGHEFLLLFELAQWLSSNYYYRLFQRPVIFQAEKFPICKLPRIAAM